MQKTSPWNSKTTPLGYFTNQLKNPYQSTIQFFDFLNQKCSINSDSVIVDACCGSGTNSFYAASKYKFKKIVGFDYQDEFLDIANLYKNNNLNQFKSDIQFVNSDIYNIKIDIDEKVDGVILLQTLSWLTDWKRALDQMNSLGSKWIAISSLFYEGMIESEITIKKFKKDQKDPILVPYNVYSIPIVEEYMRDLGYVNFYWKKFEMGIELEKPTDADNMGTYTKKTIDGETLQISGPIMLPWYFLVATR
jgi:SAM-dependent methyltransferase